MADSGQQPADGPETDHPASIISHLIELRSRLLRAVLAVLLIFVGTAIFAEEIFTQVALPLQEQLTAGGGSTMIATGVASPFLTPFKLAMVVAVFLAMPYILYQVWSFVAPGLYKQEKRLTVPLLISSTLLFYLGALFAYFVVFPLMFRFFISVAPEGVTVMTDIGLFLDFILTLFVAFGLAFEVPVATVLLVKTGFTTPAKLAQKRAYVLLGAFVIGMLLTPPDVISQTLLALPVYILYELGIIMARIVVPGHREVEAQQAEDAQKSGS